jgi:hypothetical protein
MTEEQVRQGDQPDEHDRQAQEADKQSPTAPPDASPEDQEDGRTPPPDDLTQDPAYEPDDDSLKEIKGG